MKQAHMKIRNFRISDELDHRLVSAAAQANVDPSKLLRMMVDFGTALMLCGINDRPSTPPETEVSP